MSSELETNLIRRIAVGDMLRRRAASHRDHEAIVEFVGNERRSLSFGQLNERSNQFVRAMRGAGLVQGDRVAILGGNTAAFITTLLGCFKGGFVAVPVNYLQNPDDVAYNIEHSGARALFADGALQALAAAVVAGTGREFVLGALAPCATGGDGNFMALDRLLEGQPVEEIEDIVINDDDLAQIMYTSGTTSRPKGVMASHKNIYISTLNSALTVGVNPRRSNALSVLPLFHITAEMFALCSLHLGGKVVLLGAFDAPQVLRIIERESIHTAVLLPLMWKALLASPGLGDHDYSTLAAGVYGMAPMDAPTLRSLREVFACDFMLGSGQTEVAAMVTVLQPQWGESKDGNYWGDGSVSADQAVMDDEGRLLGPGEIGEIVWRSPQTMLGYFANPEATAESRAHGWHHSGDIGFIDADGQFCFLDRKKDIVKSGGENVSSIKVESVLLGLGGVANASVFGVPHPHWGEAVTAALLLAPDATLSEQQVIAHCKEHLGVFEVPKRVVFLDALPMTATGKVRKHELRKQLAQLYDAH
jgi:long-chain acyl-CoA synthetase